MIIALAPASIRLSFQSCRIASCLAERPGALNVLRGALRHVAWHELPRPGELSLRLADKIIYAMAHGVHGVMTFKTVNAQSPGASATARRPPARPWSSPGIARSQAPNRQTLLESWPNPKYAGHVVGAALREPYKRHPMVVTSNHRGQFRTGFLLKNSARRFKDPELVRTRYRKGPARVSACASAARSR